jgi:Flp pilus assembly protein TadG
VNVRPRAPGRDERGSAVVEFALVVPLLLLVALGLIQVAVIGRDRLVVEHAARAGAREAAVTSDDAAVRDAVLEETAGLDPARVSIDIARSGSFGDPVSVRASYDVVVAAPLAGWLVPGSVRVEAVVTMRQEFG